MHIALFNCYTRAVPPTKSGGIETSMDYLIQGLLAAGQQVTLFGPSNSLSRDGLRLIHAGEPDIEWRPLSEIEKNTRNEQLTKQLGLKLAAMQDEFDVIHNHCAGVAFPYTVALDTPVVTTLHEEITPDTIRRLKPYKGNNFVSISRAQQRPYPLNYVETIYYGLSVTDFPYPRPAEDFLVCIARISQQKTPHLAIEAAARAKKKLYILGAYKDESVESDYYENTFLPTLKKHERWATWVGEVDAATVKDYLHRAQALLLPVAFEEPAGMAALEAMACGCPVIAFKRGAYAETIVPGKTGFVVNTVEEMVSAIEQSKGINRENCRHHIQKHFSIETMTARYINLYCRLCKSGCDCGSIDKERYLGMRE